MILGNNKLFDDELLDNYILSFLGYGNFASDHWFIGMEEGAGVLWMKSPSV